LIDSDNDDEGRKPNDANQLLAESCVIYLLQRVIEGVVPLIKKYTDVHHSKVQCDDQQ
jgi:hypothetical protein